MSLVRIQPAHLLKIQPARTALDDKLILLDASDMEPALYKKTGVTPTLTRLAVEAEKCHAGLIVIDNASDAFDGDEIKRPEVRGFIRALRTHLARPGRAVLLLTHINKGSANGGKSAGAEDYSGSTAWHNSVRSRLSLNLDPMTIEHMKANYGPKAGPVRIDWPDGVPVAAGFFGPGFSDLEAEKARDDLDMAALVRIIQDFDTRGERVTTSTTGSSTVHKALKSEPQDRRRFCRRRCGRAPFRPAPAPCRRGRASRLRPRGPP